MGGLIPDQVQEGLPWEWVGGPGRALAWSGRWVAEQAHPREEPGEVGMVWLSWRAGVSS